MQGCFYKEVALKDNTGSTNPDHTIYKMETDSQNSALPPASSDLEDVTITQDDFLVSPGPFVSFPNVVLSIEDDTRIFVKYMIIYPLITLLIPLVLALPLATAAYLIIRYDTQARGKLIKRARSVLFLSFLIIVFIVTIVTTFPVWTAIGATAVTLSVIFMSVVGPPVLIVASGVFVATRLML